MAGAQEAPYIETKPIHPSQMVLERMDDGTVIFQIHACHNYELEKAFLEFGEGVKVLAPRPLVSRIKKRLRLAADQYEVRTECMNSSR